MGLFALPPKPTTPVFIALFTLIRNALCFEYISVCECLTLARVPRSTLHYLPPPFAVIQTLVPEI